MAKAKKKKDDCTCPNCGGHHIIKTIGGLIVAITALVLIFDKAHAWLIIPLAAFLILMGMVLSKKNG